MTVTYLRMQWKVSKALRLLDTSELEYPGRNLMLVFLCFPFKPELAAKTLVTPT